MTKIDKHCNLKIDEVWPVGTEVVPNSGIGIGIGWSGNAGFDELSMQ